MGAPQIGAILPTLPSLHCIHDLDHRLDAEASYLPPIIWYLERNTAFFLPLLCSAGLIT